MARALQGAKAHTLARPSCWGTLGPVMSEILDKAAVLEANDAFYDAFRQRDYLAMEKLWSAKGRICCYHPGWPGITGREDVLDSWYSILVLGDTPDIDVSDATVIRNGKTAMVFCTEHLGQVSLIATNTFVVEQGEWRMVHHQAAHLPG